MTDLSTRPRRLGARALAPLLPPLRSFLARKKRTATLVQHLLDRFDPLQDAVFAVARQDPRERYREWIAAYDTVADADLEAMRDEQARFASLPEFVVVVPLASATATTLEALARSLRAQAYGRWQVEFVAATGADRALARFVAEAASRDPRFTSSPKTAQTVADAWNGALRSSASDFVIVVEPRVTLRPHALFLLARTIDRHPDATLIYADEDVIDEGGSRSAHNFKPDWNETLFRCQNYLGGLVAFRRSLALAAGGCEEEPDGDCEWGLFLRMTVGAPPETIHHLPFVLSHRAAEPADASDDRVRRERVARAIEERVARIGESVRAEPVGEKSYRTRYAVPEELPTVSVVVPSTCERDLLRPCLDGLLNRTSYPALEILLVSNGSRKDEPDEREYLQALAARPEVRLLAYEDRPFNFSRVNNWAAEQASGELLCFLNDDTEVIKSEWLSAMVGHVVRDRVAAVGGMLFYPNGRIQHAGVVLGAGDVAAHTYSRRRRGIRGYHDRALIDQEVSCVTAACMLVRRDVFLDVGGFDEALAIAFNDIDFCLRLRKAGWRIVWTPSAELYHKESASIGRHDADERGREWELEHSLIHNRWHDELMSDPHYNPNLSLDPLLLWEPAFPPRAAWNACVR